MGATDFSQDASGKSAKEAFSRAVEQAQYEHGHGGYSGTIAEKGGDGFVMLPALPPRWTAQKVEDLIGTAQYGESYKASNGTWKIRRGSQAKAAEALEDYLARGMSRLSVRQLLALCDDKWGPALCVEVAARERADYIRWQGKLRRGDRVFRFFGTASC